MGLDLPELDDRTHEELLEQAKKLIPAYSDQWTDFNPHDPGITILEILAWLTETHTYQLDQITDEHREKYLQLIGHRPRNPRPATAPIRIQSPAATGERLRAGAKLVVTDGTDEPLAFATDRDVVLTQAAVSHVLAADGTGTSDHTEANQTDGLVYRPFGDAVTPGDAVYLGFDADPFEAADSVTLWVSYHDEDLPEPAPATGDGETFDPSVDLAWSYYSAATGAWYRLDVVTDETDALYGGGVVELELGEREPDPDIEWHDSVAERRPPDVDWIRCRVETAGYEIPPLLEAVRTNVVTASHAVSIAGERLRPADGDRASPGAPALDGQTYAFANRPVLSATVSVDGTAFTEVADFDGSGPEDPHYVLDSERGRITFGDGTAGRVPPADATITADYVYGGGERGNVSAGAAWQFSDGETTDALGVAAGDVDVTPLAPASGGADAESVDAALRRAKRNLRRPQRAVTESDYQSIAARTPGLRVGRTDVRTDGEVTTLVVVPYAPPDVASPTPSDAFLETVRSHLRERTLLTDRVRVTGPQYVRLEITVTGAIRPQYAGSGYESAITDAIESYLHPLYGYDGDGWPFGRSLSNEGLIAEIEAVDAVDVVSDLSITAHGGTAFDDRTVAIDDTALFALEDVTVAMQRRRGGE